MPCRLMPSHVIPHCHQANTGREGGPRPHQQHHQQQRERAAAPHIHTPHTTHHTPHTTHTGREGARERGHPRQEPTPHDTDTTQGEKREAQNRESPTITTRSQRNPRSLTSGNAELRKVSSRLVCNWVAGRVRSFLSPQLLPPITG